jgi:hypothetical protein
VACRRRVVAVLSPRNAAFDTDAVFSAILLLLLSVSFHTDALYLSSQNKNNQCLVRYRESCAKLVLLKLVFKEQRNVFGFHNTYCKHKHEFFNECEKMAKIKKEAPHIISYDYGHVSDDVKEFFG